MKILTFMFGWSISNINENINFDNIPEIYDRLLVGLEEALVEEVAGGLGHGAVRGVHQLVYVLTVLNGTLLSGVYICPK